MASELFGTSQLVELFGLDNYKQVLYLIDSDQIQAERVGRQHVVTRGEALKYAKAKQLEHAEAARFWANVVDQLEE